MWGRGQRGNNATCSALSWLSVTSPTTHKQIGTFWCWFTDKWVVYILGPCKSFQWTLLRGWDFLPPPQPPQVFIARGFEAFFSHAGTLGCEVCLTIQLFFPVYPHANVGPSAAASTAQSSSCCLATHPLHPDCPSPPLLPACMNVSSLTPWLSDFHTVRFSGSSGCVVFKFVAVPLLVVWGGKMYLPMPSFWLGVLLWVLM